MDLSIWYVATFLISPNPNFECFSELKAIPYPDFIGQTIPVVAQIDKSSLVQSGPVWCFYCAVPSGGCSDYSILLIVLFYELAQWWWSKPNAVP